ncbi:MAG: hypothetical protein QM817_18355 [Archangium sp.]
MKWFLLMACVVSSSVAFAGGDACASNCAETVKECQVQCKKILKKDAPDKIKFCTEKCKEFENECNKDCKNQQKK